MKKIYLIGLLSILLVGGCKTNESATSTTKNEDFLKKIAVGKGGGFTGAYTEFILREDGKVFKRDFKYDREVYLKDLNEIDLNYFFDKKRELGLEGIELNKPGNMSSYIEIKEGNISLNKIVWGARLAYPSPSLINFHNELLKKLSETE